ncbi:YadA-like family protein [Edwardsiella tarda]|uniref:YadA-like family protein n=1 Tax=Edwardsiella tarda TaxID=636 RepID=UPI00351C1EA7
MTLEANRQQLAAHQADIVAANTNLGLAGAAIQQNHDGITATAAEVASVKGRLDRQQQFDQVTGVTLEANRQQLAAHQADIVAANTNLGLAGAAIQQNHDGITAAAAEVASVKGRLDRQQQFDQVTGVTLEANRQQLAAHQAEIGAANTNLGLAGAAIQQNHDGITAAAAEVASVKGRLDRQQQFDQVTGVTLEANRQQLAAHQAGIATANTHLAAAGAAIKQNHDGLTAANTEIETVKGRLDGQQQFDQLTGVTLEAHRQQLAELNNNGAKAVQNLSGKIDYLQEWQGMANNRINDLERVTAENRKVSSRGIAGVAAMANIPTPMDGGFSLGVGYGHYDNQNAFAVGASKYFESGVAIKGGISLTGKYAVVGAGASYSFK